MASDDVLERFELKIEEELLQNLFTPGKNINTELWANPHKEAGSRPPPRCSVHLEKSSDTLLKLFLTVYGSKAQTESPELDAKISQTDGVDSQHQVSQTEKVGCQDNNMQTKGVDTQHSSMQTAAKEEKQSGIQTDKKTMVTTVTQTELKVVVVQPKSDQGCQAGYWNPQDNISQTDLSMSLMVEGNSQTELVQEETGSQTDPKVIEDRDTQTVINTAEISAQTVRNEQDGCSQTEVYVTPAAVQTDLSLANLVDGEAQAVVEISSEASQATVDWHFSEAQTDSSMALQGDQEVQATVQAFEQTCQTDVKEEKECFVQTELETSQQFSQTEYLVEERDSQTELDTAEVEIQTEVEEPPVPEVAIETEGITVSQVSSVDEIPDIAGSQEQYPRLCSEEGSQTDPVTIIIGDASFLVKKLKSSSLSPTKVSSMGNEIEIELRADEEETPYDLPEKENTAAPIPVRSRGNPSPYRARGVRTRGGMSARGNPRATGPQYVAPSQQHGGQYYASSAGGYGKYSCPVCSETFHESPALYEHLQSYHAEAFNLIKKPRGREGKTILCKPVREPEPPILTPVEPIVVGPQQVELVQGTSEQQVETHTVELFEDPAAVWQSPNKSRKRTLARRQITDEEAAIVESPQEEVHIVIQQPDEVHVEAEEQIVIMGKRKRVDQEEEVVKRVRPEDDIEEDAEEFEEEEEAEIIQEQQPKRGRGRPPKVIKQEKIAPEDGEDDLKSPRTRGRLRTPKK